MLSALNGRRSLSMETVRGLTEKWKKRRKERISKVSKNLKNDEFLGLRNLNQNGRSRQVGEYFEHFLTMNLGVR